MRSLLACGVLAVLLVPLASAQGPVPLTPGVTSERHVELTPHGPVAYTVITAPAPVGLTAIGPVLGGGTVTGPRETMTQLEESVSGNAVSAGVNGDFFSGRNAVPEGIVVIGGVLEHTPTPAHSSIGFDGAGGMHVGRISFSGTWQGTGQRRPLSGVNQQPRSGQTVLFTPAWGAATPNVANAAVVVLEPFPAAKINTDLTASVSSFGSGSVPIPADGAVLVATGLAAAKLEAEAPQGTQLTVRLILPDAWGSVVSALGGGPLLVKGGKPVFATGENFDETDLTTRQARAAVGQLPDGHVILVAVEGGRPGSSVGMTTYELAKTMASLGADDGRRSSVRPVRRGGVRRAAAHEADAGLGSGAGEGGAARSVRGRLRAATGARSDREEQCRGRRAAHLPDHAALDRHRRRDLARRHEPPDRLR